MNRFRRFTLALCLLPVMPAFANETQLGADRSLLCAATRALACTEDEMCTSGPPGDVNFPRIVRVDPRQRKVVAAWPLENKSESRIGTLQEADGRILIQGVDGSQAWSVSISRASGRFVLTQSGAEVGFVVFGACIPD